MSNLICQHLDGYNRVWVNCSDSIDLTIDVGSDFGHHPHMFFMLLNHYRSYQVEEYILTSFKLAQKKHQNFALQSQLASHSLGSQSAARLHGRSGTVRPHRKRDEQQIMGDV
jgi:hypothetical protein